MKAFRATNTYYAPKNFWLILLGAWLLMSLTLGLFSEWLFNLVLPQNNDKFGQGIIYSSTYTFIFLSLFGLSWIPLNRKFPLHRRMHVVIHISVQFMIAIVGFMIGNLITGKLHTVMFKTENFEGTEAGISLALITMLCMIGILSINGFFYALSYVNRSKELEKSQTESELMALRAQINPHFLFNSLNSIAALVQTSPEQAEEVTQDLADLFRFTLRASEKSMVPLSEEIELITMYLNIESARFKDRLEIEMNVESGLKNQYIPALIIQPIVENAIKHGISQKDGEHSITIDVSQSENWINIQVLDTGPGFPHKNVDQILKKGTGISNVFKRLSLQFQNNFDFAILDNGILMKIPVTPEIKESEAFSYKLNPDIRESFSS